MQGLASRQACAGFVVRMRRLALRLQIIPGMSRFFLSGQTTCALLLGAGLLLRAQAALRDPEPAAVETTPRTRPAEMMAERARSAPRVVRTEAPAAPRVVHKITHSRKGFAHRAKPSRVCKRGVVLAGQRFRCG
jgi:hypothetical protein